MTRSKKMHNFRLTISVIAVLLYFAVVGLSTVYADFNVDDRIYRDSGCSAGNRADPVNVLFWNFGDNNHSVNHFMEHVGWNNPLGVMMYLKHHNQLCQGNTAQRASDCPTCSRDHLRFFNVNDDDPGLGLWTAGAIHFDQVCLWQHIGRSFNIERDNLLFFFSQGPDHPTQNIQWVNSYEIYLPCVDVWESVDGKLGKISIPNYLY